MATETSSITAVSCRAKDYRTRLRQPAPTANAGFGLPTASKQDVAVSNVAALINAIEKGGMPCEKVTSVKPNPLNKTYRVTCDKKHEYGIKDTSNGMVLMVN